MGLQTDNRVVDSNGELLRSVHGSFRLAQASSQIKN